MGKRFYNVNFYLVIVATLGTLSRAAWLAVLFFCVFVFVWNNSDWHKIGQRFVLNFLPVIVLILLLVGYFINFLNSGIAKNSTIARFETVKTVLFYVGRAPWLGYGPGAFMNVLNNTYVYTLDFGEALEAHGFLPKILLEEGCLGLFFFLVFLVWVFWRLYPRREVANYWLQQTLFLLTATGLIFQLFNTGYFQAVFWLPLGISLAGNNLLRNYEH